MPQIGKLGFLPTSLQLNRGSSAQSQETEATFVLAFSLNTNLCFCYPGHCHPGSAPKAGSNISAAAGEVGGSSWKRVLGGLGCGDEMCASGTRFSWEWLRRWLTLGEDVKFKSTNQYCRIPQRMRGSTGEREWERPPSLGWRPGLLEFNRKGTAWEPAPRFT